MHADDIHFAVLPYLLIGCVVYAKMLFSVMLP